MSLTWVLTLAWGLCLIVPLGWWARRRRRLDVWAALPVPAAVVDQDGRLVAATGPEPAEALLTGPPPPPGTVLRSLTRDGRPLLVRGLDGGGLAVGWPAADGSLPTARGRLSEQLAQRLAHDLSSPLMTARAQLDLALHSPGGPQAQQSLHRAVTEVERAMTLTGDLATLTSLRAGAGAPCIELAGALAEEAVTGLLSAADRAGATLRVAVPAEPLRVAVVSGGVIRALRNLVANALEHGLGPARVVEVTVAAVQPPVRSAPDPGDRSRPVAGPGRLVRFSVRDGGPGLSPQQLAELSEPLVKASSSGGSGLGLAIVAEVLAAHGSGLRTAPDAEGGLVYFDLPAADG